MFLLKQKIPGETSFQTALGFRVMIHAIYSKILIFLCRGAEFGKSCYIIPERLTSNMA